MADYEDTEMAPVFNATPTQMRPDAIPMKHLLPETSIFNAQIRSNKEIIEKIAPNIVVKDEPSSESPDTETETSSNSLSVFPIYRLQHELRIARANNQELKTENKELRVANQRLTKELEKASQFYYILENTKIDINTYINLVQSVYNKEDSSDGSDTQAETTSNSLHVVFTDSQYELRRLRAENQELETENEKLRAENQMLMKKLNEILKLLYFLNNSNVVTSESGKSSNTLSVLPIDLLQRELRKLRANNQELKTKNKKFRASNQKLTKELEKNNVEIDTNISLVQILYNNEDSLEGSHTQAEITSNLLPEVYTDSQYELRILRAEKQKLETENEKLGAENQMFIKKLHEVLKSKYRLKDTNVGIDANIGFVQMGYKGDILDKASLNSSLIPADALQTELRRLGSENQELKTENEKLKEQKETVNNLHIRPDTNVEIDTSIGLVQIAYKGDNCFEWADSQAKTSSDISPVIPTDAFQTELLRLRAENQELKTENEELRAENQMLKKGLEETDKGAYILEDTNVEIDTNIGLVQIVYKGKHCAEWSESQDKTTSNSLPVVPTDGLPDELHRLKAENQELKTENEKLRAENQILMNDMEEANNLYLLEDTNVEIDTGCNIGLVQMVYNMKDEM